MNPPLERPNLRELLEAFVASGRSEGAFTALVESYGKLIFSSALRRTSDPQLAEEVTQNVFAIIARKAESLRTHPSPRAWVFETTRLETQGAMRSERRRQHKLAALSSEANAQQSGTPLPMEHQATWKEAVPHLELALDRLSARDRDIVVQRFYEGMKFREIAASCGQTEAACKKRVKRALDKISRMLGARGVTLSTTVIASAIGTEFTSSASAASFSALGIKALATSSSLPLQTILVNTLQTMSTTKTISLTAAAVLAIFALPLAQQRAEGRRLQSGLDAVASDGPAASDRRPERGLTTLSKKTRAGGARWEKARTAAKMLASLNRPDNNDDLILSLITRDSLNEVAAWGRIAEMTPEEIKALLDDLQDFPLDGSAKDYLISDINKLAPEESPRERLERMIAGGRRSTMQGYMKTWSMNEPESALAWYREKRASGELDPGLNDELHEHVLTDLLVGLARSSPEQALELYDEVPRKEVDSEGPRWMAAAFAESMMESGDETRLVRLLELHAGKDRTEILQGALGEFARNGQLDAGMALVDQHNQIPQERNDYLESLFRYSLEPNQLKGGLDSVLASTPEAEVPEVMGRMIGRVARRYNTAAREWVESQEPGMVRDIGRAAIVDRMIETAQYPKAIAEAENINDASLRAETRRAIGQEWLENDRENAENALSDELIEQLQNQ